MQLLRPSRWRQLLWCKVVLDFFGSVTVRKNIINYKHNKILYKNEKNIIIITTCHPGTVNCDG